MVGQGDLTGSERMHISVPYRDGPLDTSESMYFHGTFSFHERWHRRHGYFTTIIAWIVDLGVLQLSCVQAFTSTACARVSYRPANA